MTKDEMKKLKETIAYFGHWYDVIGEERVLILEKSIEYITDLEKENTELKEQTEEMKNKCSTLLDKLYLSGLKPNQIALVERMQDILGV